MAGGGAINICDACQQDFGSVNAFDAHRVGKHAYTWREGLAMTPPREDGRRCLDVNELEADPRWTRNAYGRWTLTRKVNEGRALRVRSLVSASAVSQDATGASG